MKRSSHPFEQVCCPACKSKNIHSTCGRLDGDKRIRYKRCLDCGRRFKTEQQITREVIVAKRKRTGAKNSTLSEEDVLFIRQQLVNQVFSQRELAMQYEVDVSCISKIQGGKTWKDLLLTRCADDKP